MLMFPSRPMSIFISMEKALRYTITAMMTSVMYSLYAVRFFSCEPETSSMDINRPVKITPMGWFAARAPRECH